MSGPYASLGCTARGGWKPSAVLGAAPDRNALASEGDEPSAPTASRSTASGARVPDPVVTLSNTVDPEQDALLADSVGLALLVVLDALSRAERLAFVLHDVFGVPFADIATALERSEAAAQQLASRARRRVRNSPEPDRDPARQRPVVDAFFAASRDGDFDALLEVLDPDVELRIDGGILRPEASLVLHGADAVAAHTATYSNLYPFVRPALVNGAAGAIVAPRGRLFSVMGFTVSGGKITAIDTRSSTPSASPSSNSTSAANSPNTGRRVDDDAPARPEPRGRVWRRGSSSGARPPGSHDGSRSRHQVESKVPGRCTGGISRTVGRENT
jgi:hypothetical protein